MNYRFQGAEGKIQINSDLMKKLSRINLKKSAGGVMMGRYIINTHDIVVDKITMPKIGDIQWYNYFHKRSFFHNVIILLLWICSGRTCNYIGEWYFHPWQIKDISFFHNYNGWKNAMKNSIMKYMYFVIIGRDMIRVWEGHTQSWKIRECAELFPEK